LKKIWQIERNSYLCNPKRKQGERKGERERRGEGIEGKETTIDNTILVGRGKR
jgi:hypothetical protein